MLRPLVLLLALAGLALAVAPACTAAERPTPKTSLPEVERDVMCTTCGVPLLVAESSSADAQRREIQRLVDRGLTKREVEDRLVEIYGEQVLIMPRTGGLSVAAYIVPAALVALAALLVATVARHWRRRRREDDADDDRPPEPLPELSAGDARRVEADLSEYGT